MAYPVVQAKEYGPDNPSSVERDNQQPLLFSVQRTTDDIKEISTNFSLRCLLKAITIDGKTGLLSRIDYEFPEEISTSIESAFQYAGALNQQLVHSKVFVVQDVDGDQSYYLRMDTILHGVCERQSISLFFSKVNQDVDILAKYFR